MDGLSPPLLRAVQWLCATPLAMVVRDLLGHLHDLGYAETTAVRYTRAVAHFGDWARSRSLSARQLSKDRVQEFLDVHLPDCRCRPRVDKDRRTVRAALHLVLRVLAETGCIGPSETPRVSPRSRALDEFDAYLAAVRGASDSTRNYYCRYADQFLKWRFGDGALLIDDIGPDDLRRFILERADTCMAGTLGVIAVALRSYLGFLAIEGHATRALIDAVPTAVRWRKAQLPQHLTEEQLKQLLESVDLSSPTGSRDRAILLLMVVLGLRASEVAALTLDDIHWREGTVLIRARKARSRFTLPMPSLVGTAMVAYLRHGRLHAPERHVFLRHRAPVGRPMTAEVVRGAVRRAYQRAGFPSTWTGTHRLRHTAATRMVRGGATIKEVADVLGHRSIDTTAIYAKLDLERLRDVALPWPDRGRP